MSQVRKQCVNEYNRRWDSCLVNGTCPSGKNWDWVRKKVLVMIFHKKDGEQVSANSDIEAMFNQIVLRRPLWGVAEPKEWLSFMLFGKGQFHVVLVS